MNYKPIIIVAGEPNSIFFELFFKVIKKKIKSPIILIASKKLHIVDAETITEMCTFVARGASFEAVAPNHDDLVMNLVLFGWFTTTDIFQGLTNIDMKQLMYKEQLKAIQDDMLPFGIIEDGRNRKEGVGDGEGNVWFEVDHI